MPNSVKRCIEKTHATSIERCAYIYISLLTGYFHGMGKTIAASRRKEILLGIQGAFENKLVSPDDPNDPSFRLFGQAGLDILERSDVQEEFINIARHRLARKKESFAYMANITLREVNHQELLEEVRTGKSPYSEGADLPEWWRSKLLQVILPADDSQNWNLYNRTVQSNVDARYVIPKIWALMNPDRMPEQPRILDLGCSRNHGLKRLAFGDRFPFRDIKVLAADYRKKRPLPDRFDEDKTIRLNERFVHAPFSVRRSVGVDKVSLEDTNDDLWVKACTHYPGELQNKELVARFDELDKAKTHTVTQVQASCSSAHEMRAALKRRRGFDLIYASNMFYQMSEAEVVETKEIALKYLNPNGYLMTLDSADVDKNSLSGLKFPDEFYDNVRRPFGYKTMVLDARNPEEDFEEVFRWKNGRCDLLIPNLGNAVVNAALTDPRHEPTPLVTA